MARARASVNFIDASQWRVFLTLFHFLAVYTAPVRAMGRSTGPWLRASPGVDVTLPWATTSRCCMSTPPTRSPGRCSAPGESSVWTSEWTCDCAFVSAKESLAVHVYIRGTFPLRVGSMCP